MDIQSAKMKFAQLLREQNSLTEDDYITIDSRRECHLNGESKSYNWQEAKQKIQNRQ